MPAEGLVQKTGAGSKKDNQGGSAEVRDISMLKTYLDDGGFGVTAECGPPKGADPDAVIKKAELLRGKADAINVTDNQTAVVHMSSLAACILLKKEGLDPVLQM